jgi:MFS family permease
MTLLVTALGTFLVLVVYTVPLGALDATTRGLFADAGGRAWIVSGMSVGLAAALLPSGTIADARGRKRVFVAGALVLAAASVAAALAGGTVAFVAARVAQGLGGAALTACSLGIIGHVFTTPAARARATGVWGASLGAGIAVGPIVSAGLAEVLDWRGAHWFCAALALAVAGLGTRHLPESRASTPRPVDVLGAVLLSVGLSALLAGLVEGRRDLGDTVALALLVERRSPHAMLDLALFRRADFTGATVGALANGLGIIAMMSLLPTVLALGLGWSPLYASIVFLVWSGLSVVAALGTRRLPERVTPRARFAWSLLGVAVAQAALAELSPSTSPLRIVLALALAGVASGLLNATLARQAVASVPAGNAALGSGVNNTARYVGAALGTTVVAILLQHGTQAQLFDSWSAAAWVTVAASVAGALVALYCRPHR